MTESQNRKGSLAPEQENNERPEVEPTTAEVLREKSKSKVVKMLSVSVYIAAVTGNGFLLSVFYLFFWDPQIQVTRPSDMAPDYGWLGGPSRLTGHPSRLTASDIPIPQALKDPRPPTVPHHRIMSTEFTNNVVNSYLTHNVPGNEVVGGIGHAEAGVGLPSSAQENYENNNVSRSEHQKAAGVAAPTDIQSKINVSTSSENNSSGSSSSGGALGKRKKPNEEVSSPHQRPQAMQT